MRSGVFLISSRYARDTAWAEKEPESRISTASQPEEKGQDHA